MGRLAYDAARTEGIKWLKARRLRRTGRISTYSMVTGSVVTLYGLLGAFELFEDDITRFEVYLSWTILMFGLAVGMYVLAFRRELPHWFGVALVFTHAAVQVYYLGFSDERQNAIAALQELPIMAMYFSWFYGARLARAGAAVILAAVTGALVAGQFVGPTGLFGPMNILGAIALTALCLEAGLFMRRRVRSEAHTDELTGVLNRRGFYLRGESEFKRAARHDRPISVAVIDLDDFKTVNDSAGHAAGDDVLRSLAQQWRSLCRASDLVGRIGGDEFAMVLPESSGAETAQMMSRLRDLASHPWSWGVAEVRHGETLEQALQRADVAMYGDKHGQPARHS